MSKTKCNGCEKDFDSELVDYRDIGEGTLCLCKDCQKIEGSGAFKKVEQ